MSPRELSIPGFESHSLPVQSQSWATFLLSHGPSFLFCKIESSNTSCVSESFHAGLKETVNRRSGTQQSLVKNVKDTTSILQ